MVTQTISYPVICWELRPGNAHGSFLTIMFGTTFWNTIKSINVLKLFKATPFSIWDSGEKTHCNSKQCFLEYAWYASWRKHRSSISHQHSCNKVGKIITNVNKKTLERIRQDIQDLNKKCGLANASIRAEGYAQHIKVLFSAIRKTASYMLPHKWLQGCF